MTPEEFQTRIKEMREQFGELFDRHGLLIVGNAAVSWFKKNFQNQAWGRVKWREVQRREPGSKAYKYNAKHHPSRTTRKILTGDTGDLGRSIEIMEAKDGTVTIWTNPSMFRSKEPYGRVHNEGLRAGRGSGFTMPRRQFMGENPELNDIIVKKLQEQLEKISKL
jgi:phage gpG-like protein